MDAATMTAIQQRLLADGPTTFVSKNMVFACPPLVITEKEWLAGLEIIERAIAAAAGKGITT